MRKSIDYFFYASLTICAFAVAALSYFAVKYAWGIILPFLIAYLLAAISIPLSKAFTHGRSKRPGVWATVFFLIIITIGGTLIYLIASRMVFEAGKLVEKLGNGEGELSHILYGIFDTFDNLGSKIPLLNKLKGSESTENVAKYIEEMLINMIDKAVSDALSHVPSVIGDIISSLPSMLLSFLVTLIAGFYFCLDFDKVNGFLLSLVPKKWRDFIPQIKKNLSKTGIKYVKAYLLILLITAVELYLGFTVIGIEYALLLAAIIAIIDLLPVLGVGTVLVPWSIIAFIMKDVRRGIGLLILYGVVTVIRELAEPKIIGKSLGLHPIAALVTMYAGFKLFGVAGMIFGPIVATLVLTAVNAVKNDANVNNS